MQVKLFLEGFATTKPYAVQLANVFHAAAGIVTEVLVLYTVSVQKLSGSHEANEIVTSTVRDAIWASMTFSLVISPGYWTASGMGQAWRHLRRKGRPLVADVNNVSFLVVLVSVPATLFLVSGTVFYALMEAADTKAFAGMLNHSMITQGVTSDSMNGSDKPYQQDIRITQSIKTLTGKHIVFGCLSCTR